MNSKKITKLSYSLILLIFTMLIMGSGCFFGMHEQEEDRSLIRRKALFFMGGKRYPINDAKGNRVVLLKKKSKRYSIYTQGMDKQGTVKLRLFDNHMLLNAPDGSRLGKAELTEAQVVIKNKAELEQFRLLLLPRGFKVLKSDSDRIVAFAQKTPAGVMISSGSELSSTHHSILKNSVLSIRDFSGNLLIYTNRSPFSPMGFSVFAIEELDLLTKVVFAEFITHNTKHNQTESPDTTSSSEQ